MKLNKNFNLTVFLIAIICISFTITDSTSMEVSDLCYKISSSNFNKNIAKPGQNSFTALQIKKYLMRKGFKDIKRLRLDDQGIWRALVKFKKCHFLVSVDYSGTIIIKNERKKHGGL
ncbi:hypothetical protein [Bartonella sp. CB189]|uniref:hypothetical protein n=1 Tax=Bartonella sp. CB189 TaxID=3112254 RepID=UPI002F96B9BC